MEEKKRGKFLTMAEIEAKTPERKTLENFPVANERATPGSDASRAKGHPMRTPQAATPTEMAVSCGTIARLEERAKKYIEKVLGRKAGEKWGGKQLK